MSSQTDSETENRVGRKASASAVLDVFLRDVKRIFTNPIALIVFLGILVLPCLYAWYNIVASWDPYGHTSDMKVAVVNNDEAYESELVGSINLGKALQSKLESNTAIGWEFVDEATAMDGVNRGSYYAAIVIPKDFSQKMATMLVAEDGKERQTPQIDYYVNEKRNGVAVKVTDTAASTVETQINTTFSSAVALVVSEVVMNLSKEVQSGVAQTRESIIQKLANANTALGSLRETLAMTNDSLYANREAIQSTQEMLTSLQLTLEDIASSLSQSKSTVASIKANVDALYEMYKDSGMTLLLDVLKSISNELTSLSGLIDRTYDSVTGIIPVISSTQTLLGSLYDSMGQLASSNASTDGTLARIQENLESISSRISELSSSASSGLLGALIGIDSSSVAEFLKDPVTINTEKMYPVDNYGSAVAPFYTNLALWVGGFVLACLLRVEVSRKGLKRKDLSPKEAYLGRGLLFSITGIIQGFVCCMGDLILGVQCVNPVAFVLTGMFLSFVYTNIIYMLAATFKHVGRAFAMILVIMQIPGSSGMFPIEMMPKAFQVLHPFLPFSYGIAAMRETMFGFYEGWYLFYFIMLLLFLFVALLIGLRFRPKISNLVLLFDRHLKKTDFMVCEESGHFENREQSFKETVKALLHSEKYRQEAMLQIEEFEASYERKKKNGLLFMAFGPLAFLAIVSVVGQFVAIDINVKIILMFLWVIVLVASVGYMVNLEYAHQRYSEEARVLDQGSDSDITQPIRLHGMHAAYDSGSTSSLEKGCDR